MSKEPNFFGKNTTRGERALLRTAKVLQQLPETQRCLQPLLVWPHLTAASEEGAGYKEARGEPSTALPAPFTPPRRGHLSDPEGGAGEAGSGRGTPRARSGKGRRCPGTPGRAGIFAEARAEAVPRSAAPARQPLRAERSRVGGVGGGLRCTPGTRPPRGARPAGRCGGGGSYLLILSANARRSAPGSVAMARALLGGL